MRLSGPALGLCLPAVSLVAIACGTGSSMISGRELQSISVSPLSATAQGQPVQFTATGHWSAAPLIVTPQSASWGACANGLSTTAVTVSSTGLAQCAGGAKGTFSVFAFDPPLGAGVSCNAITACGGGCTISGTAQLTCP